MTKMDFKTQPNVFIFSGRRPSISDPSSDQLRHSVRELVEQVRDHTGLSHITSQSTVNLVLNFLTENFQVKNNQLWFILLQKNKLLVS
jgi:hypothetical protein